MLRHRGQGSAVAGLCRSAARAAVRQSPGAAQEACNAPPPARGADAPGGSTSSDERSTRCRRRTWHGRIATCRLIDHPFRPGGTYHAPRRVVAQARTTVPTHQGERARRRPVHGPGRGDRGPDREQAAGRGRRDEGREARLVETDPLGTDPGPLPRNEQENDMCLTCGCKDAHQHVARRACTGRQ